MPRWRRPETQTNLIHRAPAVAFGEPRTPTLTYSPPPAFPGALLERPVLAPQRFPPGRCIRTKGTLPLPFSPSSVIDVAMPSQLDHHRGPRGSQGIGSGSSSPCPIYPSAPFAGFHNSCFELSVPTTDVARGQNVLQEGRGSIHRIATRQSYLKPPRVSSLFPRLKGLVLAAGALALPEGL